MKLFLKVLLLALLTGLALAAGAVWWLQQPLPLSADSVEVSIEPGTSPRGVAQAWVQAGVQANSFLLYHWFRWSGQARRVRAGSYQIGPGTTPVALLNKMVRGEEILTSVRLIEGWTFRRVRAELARTPELKQTTAALTEAELMTALDAPGIAAEGRFYPDTYFFSKGTSDLTLLKRSYQAMQRQLAVAWQERESNTPLRNPNDALTLASIIEKETGHASERGRVAGVFINRLRIGMPLQTDPTIIYGLGSQFDGNLRKKDLQADSPFNTYTRIGLPPTPIAMPGKAALLAAVRPQPTRDLYFVSRGDGSSHFSETLAEHNRAVNQFQR